MTPSRAAFPTLSDDHVAAVALAGLDGLGTGRLRNLVKNFGSPTRAAVAVRRGRARHGLIGSSPDPRVRGLDTLADRWATELDTDGARKTLVERRARVWLDTDTGYPITDSLPEQPVLLVAEGDGADALERPRVAIVGTRAASPHGLADARDLAATLVEAGVTVVSGLAIGIDGAAHEGATDGGGPTVGVVATGLDIEYPRRHRRLYAQVRERGLVLGETGYGIGPAPWRFPVRNRIIAALADVVVVVEATASGGARITADHALRYDRPVFAVPGSRRNPAAAGTNALIADGAFPLTDWSDVLLALGMTPGARRATRLPPPAEPDGRAVLAALGGEPASPEQLAARTGLTPQAIALAVARLERTDWVTWSQGLVWPR